MNNKTPAGELSDEQIHTALDSIDPEFWDVPMDGTLQFARAIIAADRELRRGDAGMPVICHALEWTFDGEERGMRLYDDERHCLFDSQSDGGVCSPLVRQSDAQAALAAKDVELDAELKDRVALAMQIEGLRKDAERLDFLDAMEGGKWIARQSVTGRGFRVHQSSDASFNTVREAIDAAIAKEEAK